MQTDIRLNQKPLYITSFWLILIASIVPTYLSFHFSKVGLPRFLTLTSISYVVAGFYIWAEWQYIQTLKKALVHPVVDGIIFDKINERSTKFGTVSQIVIQLEYKGREHRFTAKDEYRNILKGATVRVLFNEAKPQDSSLLKENRYLKITRSTLKDN